MLNAIETINSAVNNFVWGVPAMICIFGVGLYLSIRTGFLQIRKFPYAMRTTLGRVFRKREASDGSLTPFQAVCTALAATVGTGNIAGVAGAIAIGGPGAVFWMWISALLGMCTKFAEVTLAVHFRERNAHGDLVGGPMYYIKNGLSKKWHWLAVLFSIFGVLTVFGTGNATQVNTITTAINSALLNFHIIDQDLNSTSNLILGILIAVVVGLVLLGGIKRIGSVTEKLVPFMALFYIILALGVVVMNYQSIPAVFASIISGAFHPACRYRRCCRQYVPEYEGVSRGIFSNVAGNRYRFHRPCMRRHKETGQTGILRDLRSLHGYHRHLYADCAGRTLQRRADPVRRGCRSRTDDPGIHRHIRSGFLIYSRCHVLLRLFHDHWLGMYGARCIEFLFSEKVIKPFMVVYSLVAILGATANLGLLWSIAETFNGLMAIPNLIAVFLLSGTVVKLVKEYFAGDGKTGN